MTRVAQLLVTLALAFIGGTAIAKPQLPSGTPQPIYGQANSIAGWTRFCRDYADQCGASREVKARLTPATWELLQTVNARVNARIEPIDDAAHWGRLDGYMTGEEVDKWDLAEDGRGDCEEFVLVKRKLLMILGFPPGALLPTVVISAEGSGHLVLTVRTDHGDLVLDNLTGAISAWNETGYSFRRRLDPMRPRGAWRSLIAPQS